MYQMVVLPRALDDLSRLDKAVAQRMVDRLSWLSENLRGIVVS